jgi:DNA-binding transcriptional LysR family regulator
MDLNSAWIFVRVIQTGSFSAAGRALGMPVSTVSTKISQLERRLGVSLIRRTTRQLHLSEAGTRYFEHAVRACEAVREAEALAGTEQNEVSGVIRLTAPIEIGATTLTDVLADFLARFPKVQIEMILSDRMVDLIAEGIDLALRVGDLSDSSLVSRKIGRSEFNAYASPAYLKARGEPGRPAELAGHDCLGFQESVEGTWELTRAEKSVHVKVRGPLSVNNLVSLHRMVLRGRGIAMLPGFLCAEDVAQGRLKQVLTGWKAEHYPVHLVYPQQRFLPSRTRELIAFLAKELQRVF